MVKNWREATITSVPSFWIWNSRPIQLPVTFICPPSVAVIVNFSPNIDIRAFWNRRDDLVTLFDLEGRMDVRRATC